MKKITSLILALCLSLTVFAFASCDNGSKADPTKEPSKEPAFADAVDVLLDKIVTRACELDTSEYGIKSIECTPTAVDEDRCESVLGLSTDEFASYVDSAIESKPNGSWYTHSVVVIKLKEGTEVKTVAEKIIANTKPNRFGCLKPRAIVGCYAGDYVIFSASDEETCELVISVVEELSKVAPTRIDRENDWSGGMGGLLG